MPTPSFRSRRKLSLLAGVAFSGVVASGQGQPVADPPPGFAVVELFTSEGCSSCPPADELLARIDAWADENRRPVYVLSFHVDYWNRLGWTDPYSSAEATRRQRAYAAAAGERSVYTPQLIVNGAERFVGSDSKRASAAIAAALQAEATGALTIKVTNQAGATRVAYQTNGLPEDAVVNVALIDAAGSQQVERGENAGRRLNHINVVRAFQTVSLDPRGSGEVAFERSADAVGPRRVIAYAQEPGSKRVLAAASAALP